MARLDELPTTFLEHAIKANPNAQSFPWSAVDVTGEVSRQSVVAELTRRYKEDAVRLSLPRTPAPRASTVDARRELGLHELVGPQKGFEEASEWAQSEITVVLFTSAIPSHPATFVIDNVYDSIRRQLPNSRIIILADGQNSVEYQNYKHTLIDCGLEVIQFDRSMHQTLMLKYALNELVETPLVLVGEHDWGMRRRYIDWDNIANVLLDATSPFRLIQIRQDEIGHWEVSPQPFQMFSKVVECSEIYLLPTTWFQCPMHIADCAWYRSILKDITKPDFLERDELRIAMSMGAGLEMAGYIPIGPIGRLYHLDGRGVRFPAQIGGIGDE